MGILGRALVILTISFIALLSSGLLARDVYVAPDGDDTGAGTKDRPFATLEKARDVLRTRDSRAGCMVWLRQGEYELKQTFVLDGRDSGKEGHPVSYRAMPGEAVRLMGGRCVDPALVCPVTDAGVLERIISVEARQRIRQIDLKSMGITEHGRLQARGFRRPYVPASMEIFINDEPLHLARWPNEGIVPIGQVIDPGSVPRDEDFSHRGGCFTYDSDRPSYWKKAKDIWLTGLFAYGYADDTIPVASIDLDKKTMTMALPHLYGIKSGSPWHGYYAINLLEEIDQPGEYVVDRQKGIAYFYPPEKIERISVSLLEDPMIALEGASHVWFQDLTLEVSRGMGAYIERGAGNKILDCTLRNMGLVAVCIGKGIAPDTEYRHEMTGTPVSRALGSWHEHIYANSVLDREAGTGHVVEGCHIYNMGTGGVHLGGGDRRALTPGGNTVRNCHIHHFNRLDRSYKAAVNVDGVGNRIDHCLIHDCPNSAIYLHGNDHVIEFNEVHHACLDADDMGVFYMGRDPSEQGNVIRNNFWHDNGNDHGNTTVLYFDDDSCGTLVKGNVFHRNRGTPVWINHGCDHAFIGNLFVGNGGTIPASTDTRAYDWTTDELQVKRLRQDLDILKPPYSDRYPVLVQAYNTRMGQGRGSRVSGNVSINSGDFGQGTNVLTDNLVKEEDVPSDPALERQFLLKACHDLSSIPGVEAIPIDRMGVRSSP